MVLVDDVVAGLEVGEEGADLHTSAAALRMAGLPEPEDLGVGEYAKAELGYGEAFGEGYARDHERAGRGHVLDGLAGHGGDIAVGEELGEPRGLRRRDQRDAVGRRR